MENPAREIGSVITRLTTGSPRLQQLTIQKYFVSNASFYHPFCAVRGSRKSLISIYHWYKILSPHISININSVAYDEQKLILYVNITQIFSIWIVPFYHEPVTLTTVLQLIPAPSSFDSEGQHQDSLALAANGRKQKYYIQSQNDLYQVDQFIRFVLPWGVGVHLVMLWHWFSTLACVWGAFLLRPVNWWTQQKFDNHGNKDFEAVWRQ